MVLVKNVFLKYSNQICDHMAENNQSIQPPVGDLPTVSSPVRPSGLTGLKSHSEPQAEVPGVPRWLEFWTFNFCLRDNINFGTWDGVFPTCLAHLLNVIVFLRTGFIVATSGVLLSITISVFCVIFASITVLSATGILRRSSADCRDVYSLLSVTLGTRAAAAVGLIYAFTHAVSCSLQVMGIGELVVGFRHNVVDNEWAVRGVACTILLFLLFLNAFGVKWIIRAQHVIIIFMALGVGDFVIGSFYRKIPEYGVEGPSAEILRENLYPDQSSTWHDYFKSFGIYFPSTVSVLVGFNLISDLRDPHRSITKGTFAALFCSFWVQIVFILLLGMSVLHSFLLEHPHVTVRMSALQIFTITAIFISCFSAGMGSLFNSSRVLARVAKDTSIGGLKNLNWTWEKFNVPVPSLVIVFVLAIMFVLIGRINMLAPIVTTSHFLTFAAINYAYFALSTTYKYQVNREHQATTEWLQQGLREGRIASPESRSPKVRSPEQVYGTMSHSSSVTSERSQLLGSSLAGTPKDSLLPPKATSPILSKPEDWYMKLHSRWLAICTAIVMIVLSFVIQWESALSITSVIGLIYIAVGYLSPKACPGVVEFRPLDWWTSRLTGNLDAGSYEQETDAAVDRQQTSSGATVTTDVPFISR